MDNRVIIECFFGLAGIPVTFHYGSKEKLTGRYHEYGNPVGMESGKLSGEMNYNGSPRGVLATVIRLVPGEERQIAFLLGMKYEEEASAIIVTYEDTRAVYDVRTEGPIIYWHEKLSHLQVKIPNKGFDIMINTWNVYNCFMTFIWSCATSSIYYGLRNGYGYRDTVQDIQGAIHLAPKIAVGKLRFMPPAQTDNEGGLLLVKYAHNPGREDTLDGVPYVQETGHSAYRADDMLWLFPIVYKCIPESDNLDFIDEIIPLVNKDKGTVYEHLKRTIDFLMDRLGIHGVPVGLYTSWNDCLRFGRDGESPFVAMQFYYAMTTLKRFIKYKRDEGYITYLEKSRNEFAEEIEEFRQNEDHFTRGFAETGEVIGNRNDLEADM